jgi:hypothetical protein
MSCSSFRRGLSFVDTILFIFVLISSFPRASGSNISWYERFTQVAGYSPNSFTGLLVDWRSYTVRRHVPSIKLAFKPAPEAVLRRSPMF